MNLVGGLVAIFYFCINIGNNHHPNWRTHIFSEGWPNHQPGNVLPFNMAVFPWLLYVELPEGMSEFLSAYLGFAIMLDLGSQYFSSLPISWRLRMRTLLRTKDMLISRVVNEQRLPHLPWKNKGSTLGSVLSEQTFAFRQKTSSCNKNYFHNSLWQSWV